MKKLFAILLVAALLIPMATVAFAANTTTLTTTVPAATYTLNIPADQKIEFGTTSAINIITFILLKIENRRIIWKFFELFHAKQKGASILGRIIAGFGKGYMLGSRNFPEHFLFRRTVDTSIPDQNILSRQTGINEK